MEYRLGEYSNGEMVKRVVEVEGGARGGREGGREGGNGVWLQLSRFIEVRLEM